MVLSHEGSGDSIGSDIVMAGLPMPLTVGAAEAANAGAAPLLREDSGEMLANTGIDDLAVSLLMEAGAAAEDDVDDGDVTMAGTGSHAAAGGTPSRSSSDNSGAKR